MYTHNMVDMRIHDRRRPSAGSEWLAKTTKSRRRRRASQQNETITASCLRQLRDGGFTYLWLRGGGRKETPRMKDCWVEESREEEEEDLPAKCVCGWVASSRLGPSRAEYQTTHFPLCLWHIYECCLLSLSLSRVSTATGSVRNMEKCYICKPLISITKLIAILVEWSGRPSPAIFSLCSASSINWMIVSCLPIAPKQHSAFSSSFLLVLL